MNVCTLITTCEDIEDDLKVLVSSKFTDQTSALSHCHMLFLLKLFENEIIDKNFKLCIEN